MSTSIPINSLDPTAPTPQNTPLTHAPIAQGLSRPTVPDITESEEPAEDEEPASKILSPGAQAAMLGLVQGKLAGLIGRSSGYIENLPEETKRSVQALKGVQVKQNELQNQYKRECLELEKKYATLQKPLWERRRAIVLGEAAPTTEEVAAGEADSAKDDEEYEPLPPASGALSPAAIPEFWLTALRNHPGLNEMITERDVDALKQLTDITVAYLMEEKELGFKLQFHFAANDFFTNTLLEKTYLYQAEVGYTGDFVYDRAIGSKIDWKEDKDLTKSFEIKKQRNKNTNRTRLVRKAKSVDSFFNFFSPPTPPTEDQLKSGNIDDEDLESIEERLEIDYQVGEDLKEKIIPRAVDWFTGRALEFEGFDDDDDFESLEDDDDDDDANFEDEDDSEEEEVPARRRGPPRRAAAAENVNAEECKQQ